MPEISRFFGIRIAMFFNENNPPHFHALYEGLKVAVNIRTLAISEGSLSPRAPGLGDRMGGVTPTRIDGRLESYSRRTKPRQDCSAPIKFNQQQL